VYRELIQNANDAGATEVQIEFKTNSENSSSKRLLIKSIVIRNNGRAFTDDDWRRLKKIAEGNPDEQKVLSTS
jgi:DNA mismatch repair ATPase MutL